MNEIAALTESQVEEYEHNGVVCLRNVIPMDWIELLRMATEEAMRRPGPNAETYGDTDPPLFFGDLDVWMRNDRFKEYVLRSPAGALCGQAMQSKTSRFFYDQLLVKEIGSSDRTPWHQDQPYWAVRGRQVSSIWVPLDVVPEENALEYVRKSHLWSEFNPQHFNDHTPYEGTGLPSLPDIEADRDAYDIVRYGMEPGDALVFQAMIVHGAPGNASAQHRRRAYATRWIGDDARYYERPGEMAIPTFETPFKDGDPYSGDLFPLVYSA
ncbi:MAG: phytanoyl-CoA dioxygenase family protein [Pseudomonadota bacterium]